MAVHRGQQAEYARRHQPIWPELEAVLLRHGVQSYSIYLDPDTDALFAYVEFQDEAAWRAVADTDVCSGTWRQGAASMAGLAGAGVGRGREQRPAPRQVPMPATGPARQHPLLLRPRPSAGIRPRPERLARASIRVHAQIALFPC